MKKYIPILKFRGFLNLFMGICGIFLLNACHRHPDLRLSEQTSGIFSYVENGVKCDVFEVVLHPLDVVRMSALDDPEALNKRGPLCYVFDNSSKENRVPSIQYWGDSRTILNSKDEVRYFTALCSCGNKEKWHIVSKVKFKEHYLEQRDAIDEEYRMPFFLGFYNLDELKEAYPWVVKKIPPGLYSPKYFYYVIEKKRKKILYLYNLELYEWTCSGCESRLTFYRVVGIRDFFEGKAFGGELSHRVLYIVSREGLRRFDKIIEKLYKIPATK